MSILHRRFAIVAILIAALGVLTSILIQETRPARQFTAPASNGMINTGKPDCMPFRSCRISTPGRSISTV